MRLYSWDYTINHNEKEDENENDLDLELDTDIESSLVWWCLYVLSDICATFEAQSMKT